MNILVNQIGWECIIRLDGIYKHTRESGKMGMDGFLTYIYS